jgi:rhodanese-related sulfurtransferase
VSTVIDRDEVQRLVREEQAQLVEVLPTDEYDDEHLPGAINLTRIVVSRSDGTLVGVLRREDIEPFAEDRGL